MNGEILLADDEATFRETLSKVLEEEGLNVTAVADGTDAIDAITKRSYGVAILDIQMPGADGIKVLREIMRVRPEMRVLMGIDDNSIWDGRDGGRGNQARRVRLCDEACNVRRHTGENMAAIALPGAAG
jgi:CheY-like chemotaxis protein